MPDHPHIKRFEEHQQAFRDKYGLSDEENPVLECLTSMLKNLAEHVERLEQRLESHTHSIAIPAEGHTLDYIRETDPPTDTTSKVGPSNEGGSDEPDRTGTPDRGNEHPPQDPQEAASSEAEGGGAFQGD